MGTPPLPEHSPAPGSAHPVPSCSHLPVPRQISTTSAAPTTLTSSAREYRWHCGLLQPAVKLTLAPSISSPLLHQGRAEDTGAAVPQGRGTMGTCPLPWPPAKGQAAPAAALDSAQKRGTVTRREGHEVAPRSLTGECRCTEAPALVHSPQIVPRDCQQRDPQPVEGRGVRVGTSSPVTPQVMGVEPACPPPRPLAGAHCEALARQVLGSQGQCPPHILQQHKALDGSFQREVAVLRALHHTQVQGAVGVHGWGVELPQPHPCVEEGPNPVTQHLWGPQPNTSDMLGRNSLGCLPTPLVPLPSLTCSVMLPMARA